MANAVLQRVPLNKATLYVQRATVVALVGDYTGSWAGFDAR